jgi:hypothetical protein
LGGELSAEAGEFGGEIGDMRDMINRLLVSSLLGRLSLKRKKDMISPCPPAPAFLPAFSLLP